MHPGVSIVLPSFNGERFIRKSIESCLNQTYGDLELIIVDDASTDETPTIIREYARLDSRIRILTNRVNRKLPSSLNVGHQASVGEFITWTSDDNYYHHDALRNMVEFLNTNPTVGMTYCNYAIINFSGDLTGRISVPTYESLANYNCIGACFLYRRSVYGKIGFYSDTALYAEDYDYWLRIASHFSIVPIHKELYYYRSHEGSLTSRIKNNRLALARETAIMRNLAGLNWLSKRGKFEKAVNFARKAYYRKDYRRLVIYLISTFRQSPVLAADWFHKAIIRKFA